jgi:predicted TIM-barrel fold metal-dependent hydrolase
MEDHISEVKSVSSQPWFAEWLKEAIRTEDYQRKHFDKFGYEALLEACRKLGVPVLIQPESKSDSGSKIG